MIKIKTPNKCNTNVQNFFDLRKKIITFLEIILFRYLKLNAKENTEKDWKYQVLKKMVQRLPIALVQVKAGNTFEKLLNEIRQIINILYPEKETTTKIYNNIMNSIKL